MKTKVKFYLKIKLFYNDPDRAGYHVTRKIKFDSYEEAIFFLTTMSDEKKLDQYCYKEWGNSYSVEELSTIIYKKITLIEKL